MPSRPPRPPLGLLSEFRKELTTLMLKPSTYVGCIAYTYAYYLAGKHFQKEKSFAELHQWANTRRNATGQAVTSNKA